MNLIEEIIKEYSGKNSYGRKDFSSFLKVSAKWEEIVGSSLSKISKPEFYKASVLTVCVTDNAWANEFMLYKTMVMNKTKQLSNVEVKDIKIHIGALENTSSENKNGVQKEEEDYALSENDETFVSDLIKEANIENENLRNKFKRTLETYIKNYTDKK